MWWKRGARASFFGQEGVAPQKTWSWALELLEELKGSGQHLDQETLASACGAAMEACQRASRWEPALELLADIRRLGPLSSSNYRSAIIACERGGEPLPALWLLDEMLEKGMEPDEATYNSAVGACRAILRTLRSQSKTMSLLQSSRSTRQQAPRTRRRSSKRQLL